MKRSIPMASADLDERDFAAVLDVLRGGRLALGPKTVELEQAFAARVGVPHAVAVNSGTAALHLIVKALGLGPGDEVLVPSFTFAASANAVIYEGATPVFVDIEADTYNIDPADAARKISDRTRAIMVVDVFGHPAEWDDLSALAEAHDLELIDDSCEALGATYRNRPIGSLGSAAAFAFYPNKQITTGEGGMILTAREDIARKARSLRNQGRGEMGTWLEHEELGYNYRLDEMSAALGVSQLARLDEFLARRLAVAQAYTERLAAFDWVKTQVIREHVGMSWFVYVVTLGEGVDRVEVSRRLDERGVPSRGYFAPLHLQPYIRRHVPELPRLPRTEDIARRTLALPFHNRLTDDEIDHVVESLRVAVEDRGLPSEGPSSYADSPARSRDGRTST